MKTTYSLSDQPSYAAGNYYKRATSELDFNISLEFELLNFIKVTSLRVSNLRHQSIHQAIS